jgi:hypothetical protein
LDYHRSLSKNGVFKRSDAESGKTGCRYRIHTGKMTREEAIKYFLSNISYDEGGATAELKDIWQCLDKL